MSKNLLYGAKTYLIGNLQNESEDFAIAWRKDFETKVAGMGVICLSPLDKVFINFPHECKGFREELFQKQQDGKTDEVYQIMKDIRRRDLALCDASQFIVCVLDSTIPSFGTIEELAVASRSNKPVFIVVKPDAKKIPLWIAGMFKPSCFYNSLDEIVAVLKQYNSGEKELNTKYWRLFHTDYLSSLEKAINKAQTQQNFMIKNIVDFDPLTIY